MKKISHHNLPAASLDAPSDRKLLLYVEDEADNREVTVLRLRDRYDILWARDDREACELVQRNHERIYAILMDIQLKGSQVDGITLTRILRGQRLPQAPAHARGLPPVTAPILFVTAYGTRYSEDELFAAGASYVITKPVDFADLNMALMTAYARRSSPSDSGAPRRDPLAIKDSLTGLFTHRYFLTVLSSELTRAAESSRKLGLILLDVDHFKAYNDRCGRAQGDALLRHIALLLGGTTAEALARSRGRTPELVCRYSGGGLGLLVPDADLDAARLRAEGIRKAVLAHSFPGGEGQPGGAVTVSAGVSAFPQSAARQEQLIEAAERALRQAKLSGRGRVEIGRAGRFE